MEMTRSDVTQCSLKSPAPLARNAGFYLSRSASTKLSGPKPGWLQNLGTDAGTCVHHTTTCLWYQRL